MTRVWDRCTYCKDGKVPRSKTDIMDDCTMCRGLGGEWVDQFVVEVGDKNPFVVFNPEKNECQHKDLYADHEAGTIRCRDCGTPVEIRSDGRE